MSNFETMYNRSLLSVLLFMLKLLLSSNIVLAYDPNGILRSSINGLSHPVNFIQIQNNTQKSELKSVSLNHEIQSHNNSSNVTSPVNLNMDYDLEPDTNKTKRSKAALRWLKQALGLGSNSGGGGGSGGDDANPTSESEAETLENSVETTTVKPSSSIISKFNPLNFKGKVSSKVSAATNAAGQVYQTIAGAIGLGKSSGGETSSSGTESKDDDETKDMAATGTKGSSADEDEGSSGVDNFSSHISLVTFTVLLTVFLPLGYSCI